jgi:hypothetical protein
MHTSKGTYYKALILLVVFSMNILVGFACSLGGVFHEFHHKSSSTSLSSHSQKHHSDKGHQHGNSHSPENDHGSGAPDSENNCCSDSVVEMQKLAKTVSRSIDAPDNIAISSFIAVFSELFLVHPEQNEFATYEVRRRVPSTIQDLRIVMQSFQI